MTTLDARTHPRNAALLPQPDTANPDQALLRVDRAHPFFFDHPLDHLPGLLLLEAAVQLVQRSAPSGHFVSAIEGRFLRYALFDAPVQLQARPLGQRIQCVTLSQRGQARAEVTVTLAPFALPAAQGSLPRPLGLTPAPQEALNKSRPENVLIATPQLCGDQVTAWLLPPPETCLMTDSAQALHPLCLLEAFMQVQRFLNSQRPEMGRMRDILTGVSFRQYAPVIDRSTGLRIEGSARFTETGPSRLSRKATIAQGGIAFAECALHTALAGRATSTG